MVADPPLSMGRAALQRGPPEAPSAHLGFWTLPRSLLNIGSVLYLQTATCAEERGRNRDDRERRVFSWAKDKSI